MTSFDRWLEKPYTDRAAEEAAFEEWCDINDEDYDDESSYQRFLDSQEEIGPDPDDQKDDREDREAEMREYDYDPYE